jgi:hypothetical protein
MITGSGLVTGGAARPMSAPVQTAAPRFRHAPRMVRNSVTSIAGLRANYLIDRFRVGYQFGGGWTCGCADFAALDACRHTREAAGRLAAQAQIKERISKGSLQVMNSRRGDRVWRPALAAQHARVDLLVDGVTGAGRALEPLHVEN